MKKIIILLVMFVLLSVSAKAALTDDLEGYWSFDSDDNGVDSTGVNNGSCTNCPVHNTTNYQLGGGSYDFQASRYDAFHDEINIDADASINSLSTFTVQCWLYIDNATEDIDGTHVWWNDRNTGNDFQGGGHTTSANTPERRYNLYDGASTHNSVVQIAFQDWEHVVLTKTGTTTKFYLNDDLKSTWTTANFNTGTSGFSWGTYNGIDNRFDYNGFLDECAIWSRVLTDVEIGELYNSNVGLAYPFTSPVAILTTNTNIVNQSDIGMIAYPNGIYKFNVNGSCVNCENDLANFTIYLNGTANKTYNNVNLSLNTELNFTFANEEKAVNITVTALGTNSTNSTLMYYVYMDGINPEVSFNNFNNNSIYYRNDTAETFSFEFLSGDTNLLATNVTILNSTGSIIWQQFNNSIAGTNNNFNKTLNLNTNASGRFSLVGEAWDDHTKQSDIKPVSWTTSPDNIIIDDDITLSGTIKEELTEFILSEDGTKYKFKITWEDDSLTHTLYIETGEQLDYLPNSDYLGHFVYWPAKRWIDLENDNIKDLEITQINDRRYKIDLELYSISDEVEFESIGDLNFQSTTVFFNISDTFLIYALDAESNATISEFTAVLYNSTYSQEKSTTNGKVAFNITSGLYDLNLTAAGYLPSYYYNLTPAPNTNFTGYMNITNAFKVYIRDQETLDLITQLVNLEFIGTINSTNTTTSSGIKFMTTLQPDDYIIRYSSSGYANAFYYFTLENASNVEFTIYMLSNTTSDEVTATVIDDVADNVAGAYIHVQRYDLNTNSYITVEIVQTNFEGQAKLHLTKGEEFYKFLVYYEDVLYLSTAPTYIFEDTITFQIRLGDDIAQNFYNIEDTSYSLVFNEQTRNFRYTYADTSNTVTSGELKVYIVNASDEIFFNSTSVSAASATILEPVTNRSGRTYRADAYLTINGKTYFVTSAYYQFAPEKLDADNEGLFYVMILCILFATLAYWDIVIALIIMPLPLVFASMINFIDLPLYVTMPIQVLFIIIAVVVAKNR